MKATIRQVKKTKVYFEVGSKIKGRWKTLFTPISKRHSIPLLYTSRAKAKKVAKWINVHRNKA